ncbi:MAG: hypothetical protein E7342_05220 [Clostridiales bacterium]|nr:hypothetical protein [Clostridiales bacterium]
MKKRILALVAMVAVLATAMSLCISSLSAQAAVKEYSKNFAAADWFDKYAAAESDHVTSTDDYDAFDLTWVPANDYDNGQTWGPRHYQGLEIRREKATGEQYLYMYDKGMDMHEDTTLNGTTNWGMVYSFWNAPSTISAAALSDNPLDVELVFKKDGAGWETGGAVWVRIALWGGNVHAKTAEWTDADWEANGLVAGKLDENPNANYTSGWYYTYITDKINSDGTNNEYYTDAETGWSVIRTKINVPKIFDGATRFSIQFRYADQQTEEVEDLALKIKRFTISANLDLGFKTHEATFDKDNPANIEIQANVTADSTMEMFENGLIDPDGNYYVDQGKIVLKKEFLSTLSNGQHTFTIEVDGDSASAETFVVTVVGGAPADVADEGGCGSVIGATSAVLATALLAGAVVVFKKKD